MIKRETRKKVFAFLLALILVLPAIFSGSVYADTKNDSKKTDGSEVLFKEAMKNLPVRLDAPIARAPVNNNKHIAEMSFSVDKYAIGLGVLGIQVNGQTDGVRLIDASLFVYDKEKSTWVYAKGNIQEGVQYRLKLQFRAKDGYDFEGLTKEKITMGAYGSALEYDSNKKEAIFELPILTKPVMHSLTFNTNGGSNIEPVKKEKGTEIDLAQYVPTKDGFDFAGWYNDAQLMTEVKRVVLSEDMTLYAKWTKKEEKPEPQKPKDNSENNGNKPDSGTSANDNMQKDTTKDMQKDMSKNMQKDMTKNMGKDSNSAPKTGDNSSTFMYILIICAGALGVTGILRNRIKNEK